MVSPVRLRKSLLVVLGVLCVGLPIAWAVRTFLHHAASPSMQWESLPEVESDEIPGHPTPRTWDLYPIRMLSTEEYQKLEAYFDQLTEAYTNGYYDAVSRLIDDVPDTVYFAPGQSYRRTVSPFVAKFESGFLSNSAVLRDFDDEEDFSRFIHANFKIAKRLGRIDVIRLGWEGLVKRIDPEVLLQLRRYRAKFQEEGKEGFVQAADQFQEEWHRHIESENGCTRQYMWRLVDFYLVTRERRKENMRRHGVDVWLSRDEIFKIVRPEADQLIHVGYTPKWLDEFK